MIPHIYFIRHGETISSDNAYVSIQDASEKISLSQRGIEHVRQVILPDTIEQIVISDSLRTKQTAEILKETNNLTAPIIVEELLHPWKSGADTWEDYWKRFYFYLNNILTGTFETKESMCLRVQQVIHRYSNCNTLIVAHSALISAYMGLQRVPYAELIQLR